MTAITLWGTDAQAERLYTYWRLEAPQTLAPSQVALGEVFVEQRLLPVKLVELSKAAISAENRVLAEKGALLYLVFNADGRMAYCTSKDKNHYNPFSVPILLKRPCFIDTDGDGAFDRTFSVFDKYGAPPTARGNTAPAMQIEAAPFRQVDPHLFRDMRMSLKLVSRAKPSLDHIGVALAFDDAGDGDWETKQGAYEGSSYLVHALNVTVLVKNISENGAEIETSYKPDQYVFADNYGAIHVASLPSFIPVSD